jgi:hypothetical protein
MAGNFCAAFTWTNAGTETLDSIKIRQANAALKKEIDSQASFVVVCL